MAEILDVNEMLANTYEPLRKFRFILAISGIDAFTVKAATRPQVTFGETVIDFINTKRYLSGKAEYGELSITLVDPIVPSASQKVMEWVRLNYEAATGRMGYAQFYKKDFNIKMLDPVGAVVQDWLIQGAWIKDFNGNELDYTNNDPADITLSVRFDQFILQF